MDSLAHSLLCFFGFPFGGGKLLRDLAHALARLLQNFVGSSLNPLAHCLPCFFGLLFGLQFLVELYGFRGRGPQEEAVALVRGKVNGKTAPLVRVHSQCLTGDVLASLRCDCRAQLELALSLPDGPVLARGRVRWVRDVMECGAPGLGVAFDDLSDEARSRIEAFCTKRVPWYYDL